MEQITTELSFQNEKNFLSMLDNTIQRQKDIEIVDNAQTLASTDMKKIFLNFKGIRELSGNNYYKFLILLKGLNYHELAHIMYTRYTLNGVYTLRHSLNLLEDQRIENLASGVYQTMRDYFKALAMHVILNKFADNEKSENDKSYYLLLYGRRLIINNNSLMSLLRQRFVGCYTEDLTCKVEKIIDEYLITFDVPRQKELATELHELLNDNNVPIPKIHNEILNTGNVDKKRTSKEEKNASEELKKAIEKANKEKSESDGDAKSDGDDAKSDGDDAKSDGDDAKSDGDSDGDSVKKSIVFQLEKSNNESTEKISVDIESQMKVMNQKDFNVVEFSLNKKKKPYSLFSPTATHKITVKRLTTRLKMLKSGLGNSTVHKQKSGKIDLKRAMNPNNDLKIDVFKKFKPSRLDKTKLDVSLFIDASSSMDETHYKIAMGTCWTIANALEKTDSKTQIFEFAKHSETIKKYNDNVKNVTWGRFQYGNTYIGASLDNAYSNIDKNSLNKIMIIITDGMFSDYYDVIEKIKKFRKENIEVYIIRVGNRYNYGRNVPKDILSGFIKVKQFNDLDKKMNDLISGIQGKIKCEV